MKQQTDIKRFETEERLSRAINYRDLLFFSGFTAPEAGNDIRNQTTAALEKMDAHLAKLGVDKTHLITVQIWLRNINRDFSEFNQIWDAWAPKDKAPCRYAGEVKMGNPDALVELIAVAATK